MKAVPLGNNEGFGREMGRKSIHQLRVCLVLGAGGPTRFRTILSAVPPMTVSRVANRWPSATAFASRNISNRSSYASQSPELGSYGSIDPIVAILLVSESAGSSVSESRFCIGLHESLTNPRRQYCVCSWHKHGHTRCRKLGLHLQLQDEREREEDKNIEESMSCACVRRRLTSPGTSTNANVWTVARRR